MWGSARWARVMPMRSTCPSSTARAAVAMSVTRWAWMMGMSTWDLMALARCRKGATGKGHVGHVDGEAAPVDGHAGPDVQQVDLARLREPHRDLQALLVGEPVLDQLVRDHAHAHDVVGADLAAHLLQDLVAEAQAIVEAAAVLVRALVGARRPEGRHQMHRGEGQLDAVEPALLAAPRRLAEIMDDAAEVPVLHLLRERAVLRLAHPRGRHRHQPVAGVPARAAAHMGELAHQRGALAVDALGELLEIGQDAIVADVELAEGGRTFRRHHRRTAEHGHGEAASGLLLVVALVALLRHGVLGIGRRMGGADDAVPERQSLDGQRLQEGVVLGHGRSAVSVVILAAAG